MPKRGPGHPPHVPNQKTRDAVREGSANGMTQEQIAAFMGISHMTLRKYYLPELKLAEYEYVQKAAKKLLQIATADDRETIGQQLAASIFILKTRGGWREVNRTEITGKDGGAIQVEATKAVIDPRQMSVEAREEFRALIENKLLQIENNEEPEDIIDAEYEEAEPQKEQSTQAE